MLFSVKAFFFFIWRMVFLFFRRNFLSTSSFRICSFRLNLFIDRVIIFIHIFLHHCIKISLFAGWIFQLIFHSRIVKRSITLLILLIWTSRDLIVLINIRIINLILNTIVYSIFNFVHFVHDGSFLLFFCYNN